MNSLFKVINNCLSQNDIYHFDNFDWNYEDKNYKMIGISSTIGKSKIIHTGTKIQLDQIISREINGNKLILKIRYSTGEKIKSFGPICHYKKSIDTIHKIEDHLGVEKTNFIENENDKCMHGNGNKQLSY